MKHHLEPDHSEIEHALQLLDYETYERHRLTCDTLSEAEIERMDRIAAQDGHMLRTLADENLRAAVALAGGDIEDPDDLYRLRDHNTACKLAFTLKELAASIEAWGLYEIRPLIEESQLLYAAYVEIRGERAPLAGMEELASERLAAEVSRQRAAAYVARVEKMEAEAALKCRSAPLKAKADEKKEKALARRQALHAILARAGITDTEICKGLDQRILLPVLARSGVAEDVRALYGCTVPLSEDQMARRRLRDDAAALKLDLVSAPLSSANENRSLLA